MYAVFANSRTGVREDGRARRGEERNVSRIPPRVLHEDGQARVSPRQEVRGPVQDVQQIRGRDVLEDGRPQGTRERQQGTREDEHPQAVVLRPPEGQRRVPHLRRRRRPARRAVLRRVVRPRRRRGQADARAGPLGRDRAAEAAAEGRHRPREDDGWIRESSRRRGRPRAGRRGPAESASARRARHPAPQPACCSGRAAAWAWPVVLHQPVSSEHRGAGHGRAAARQARPGLVGRNRGPRGHEQRRSRAHDQRRRLQRFENRASASTTRTTRSLPTESSSTSNCGTRRTPAAGPLPATRSRGA